MGNGEGRAVFGVEGRVEHGKAVRKMGRDTKVTQNSLIVMQNHPFLRLRYVKLQL